MKGLLYLPLAAYLTACQANEVQLSFEDIERILGRPLPPTAHRAAWWANIAQTGQARAWLDAGWVVKPHARVGVVTFRRRQRKQPAMPTERA
jgi:hypothetical protein